MNLEGFQAFAGNEVGGNTLDFEYPVFLFLTGGWQSGLMHQLRKLTGLTTPRVRISHRLRMANPPGNSGNILLNEGMLPVQHPALKAGTG
jgi:hypothetical protein